MGYPIQYQVKQFIAVVKNSWGQRFGVYKTGDPQYYLFDCLIGDTTASGGHQFPVLIKSLRDDIRRALRNGVGNSL